MGRVLIVFILALFSSFEASANPMWIETLRSTPTDGPHVKLVYLADKAKSVATPPVLGCHGTSCSPWQVDSDTTGDTGSGVKALRAMHMCDCYVPSGTELKYESADKSSYSPSTSVTVPASYQRDPVPGAPCVEECALAQGPDAGNAQNPDSALPAATGGSPSTDGTASPSGGTCTFAPAGRQATIPLLAIAAGIILLWRRRP